MTDWPVLTTPRLQMQAPVASDEAQMFAIISDPRTSEFLGPAAVRHEHFSRFQRNAGSWLLSGYGGFMVRERDGDGAVIGNCGIFHTMRGLGADFDDRPEAGWIIRADRTGRGYAREAMQAAFEWFDATFGLETVCMIEPGNAASMALAERLDFSPMRDATLPDGDAVRLFRRSPRGG